MSLLQLPDRNTSDPMLKAIFDATEASLGVIPNALKLYGIQPVLLGALLKAFEEYRNCEGLRPILFICIRFAYAVTKGFPYCINLNTYILKRLGMPADVVDNAKNDWKLLPMSDEERELIAFSLKVANTPEDVNAEDITRMKSFGWTEKHIYTAADQAARMNYGSTLIRAFKPEIDTF